MEKNCFNTIKNPIIDNAILFCRLEKNNNTYYVVNINIIKYKLL